ncbi:hypothetical protein D3C71_1769800 [compost metagenome]
MEPITKIANAASRTGLLPNLSDRAPAIKCVNAVATAYPPTAILIVAKSVSNSLAMLGIEGTNMLNGRTPRADRAISNANGGAL